VQAVWRGLAAFGIGFAAMFLFSWGLAAMMGQRRPDVFAVFNQAFQRITQGDYKVQIPASEMDKMRGGPGDTFKVMAENLNTMAGSLARMEDLRRQFVADVSHEFQSPLTSILGFAEAMKAPLSDDLRRRYLEIIEAEARRLSRMSANLLKINSLEDRDGPPDPTQFRLDSQLRHVVVTLEPQWSAKGLSVEADLIEVEVVGNKELWAQAWTNLVHNAIKFTPAGGLIRVKITPGPTLAVEVTDTGIGLAPEDTDRVFERFYKADSSRGAEGSGLGLALVRRIVTLHRGTVVALSSGRDQGTTFRVEFPRLSPER
jgi:signal transduction histidine kinase